MKKWYLICGVLAILWLVSLGTCSSKSAEVDRLKDEVAELTRVKAELNELQTSYNSLLSEYNELQAETTTPPEETETPPSETRIEKLPYSWTEGVFLITIHEVFKDEDYTKHYGEGSWEYYRVRISYKNTSHRTAKADINTGTFKLKTDTENLYDLKYCGGMTCYFSFAPEDSYETTSIAFKIRKGEKPEGLWLYKPISYDGGWPNYSEQPSIIFKLGI